MSKSKPSFSPDKFVIEADDPLAASHRLLNRFLAEPELEQEWWPKPGEFASGKELLAVGKPEQVLMLRAALVRAEWLCRQGKDVLTRRLAGLIQTLAGRKLPCTEGDLISMLEVIVPNLEKPGNVKGSFSGYENPIPGAVSAIVGELEERSKEGGLPEAFRGLVERLHARLKEMCGWGSYAKTVAKLEGLLVPKAKDSALPDETDAWAKALREEIGKMRGAEKSAWMKLLENVPAATVAKPTAKWKASADELLAAVGREEFARRAGQWFGLIGAQAKQRMSAKNGFVLRALVWYTSILTGEAACRALANAVEGGLRKLPQGGLYASSISKACIAALENMPGLDGIAQLSRLKHRVKSPWGQEEIQKAFANAVHRSGVSPDEVEEITLPTFGLEGEGKLRRSFGPFSAELSIEGTHEVAIGWLDEKGKPLGKAPKKVDAAEVKALKRLAGDIEKMLLAQRDRIERLPMSGERSWAMSVWRERYLEHPLVAKISRRLIWQFTEGKCSASGIWIGDGKFVECSGRAIEWLTPKTSVRLWHPLGVEPATVQAWRLWLEKNEVTQPFKQAHREIYVITDAEHSTRTYSNRFAAHIIRQHQFKSLCDQRGWKYDFHGSWDSGGNTGATVDLPHWNLGAQFWVDDVGSEFADSGVALQVGTDQVRFCGEDGEPIELASVPALVFSEVMRDVDLFVGVCSLAADPTWADQGDQAQRTYWQQWAFGDLTTTAEIRRDVLGRLVPKLKIASQCSMEGKYLVVRGSLRNYKIHVGSGNILMSPNDEYLCIVPDRSGVAREKDKVLLPFEGDSTLAVILSKAFLLAADGKITDESILKQIKKG